MSKKMHRGDKVEIQRGPINLDQQYQISFDREPEKTRQDIQYNEMRRSGQTLTLHEPKR